MTTETTQIDATQEDASSTASAASENSSDATPEANEATAPDATTAESAAPAETAAPEIPEAYRNEDGTADLAKLIERAAAADARAEGVPETVDGYDLTLSEEIKIGDETLTIDKDNPILKEALNTFHEAGLPQEKVSALMTQYAKALAADIGAMNAAGADQVTAEIAKLGENGPARIEGMSGALKGIVGEEKATALLNNIRDVAGFEAAEALISKINGGDEISRTPAGQNVTGPKPLAEVLYPNQSQSKRA